MPDQEQVSFDIDPRSVLGAIKQMNSAMEGYEKGSTSANANLQKAIERTSDLLLKVNDRSRTSMERLTQSIEKQAAAYGKTNAERMVAERDRIIKKLGDEKGMIDRVNESYAKMLAADAAGQGAAGIQSMGYAAQQSKASLALMGEEIGIHIPRQLRTFITMLPGVGQALDVSFKAVAIIALIAVIYEAVKKVLEFRKALDDLHTAAERNAAEFDRFADSQKLANLELKTTNDQLENAIAKLQHKPENNLKIAIDEAATAALNLSERMDKSLRSFAELAQKNAPGMFAEILGRQQGTKDITELIQGKSGFGGMVGDMYAATNTGGDPTAVLSGYRARVQRLLETAVQNKAFQEGLLVGPGMPQMQPGTPVTYNPALGPVESTAQQGPRIETLNALIRQIDLLTQSYALEKQHTALQKTENQLKDDVSKSGAFVITDAEMQKIQNSAPTITHPPSLYPWTPEIGNANALGGWDTEFTYKQEEVNKFNAPREAAIKAQMEARMKGEEDLIKKNDAERLSSITAEATYTARVLELRKGPGGEIEVARAVALVREDALRKELDLTGDQVKYRQESLANERDMRLKIAEIQDKQQEKQHEELAKTSTVLWDTLLTKPGEFGKQLTGTIHAAVLKPITEGLGNLTANALKPIIYGADGTGGISGMFGGLFGKQDPIKTATDQNTLATRQNSQAMYQLSELLARASGVSISSLATPAILPGLAGILPRFGEGGITNGPSIAGEDGPELVIPLSKLLNLAPTPFRPLVGQTSRGEATSFPGVLAEIGRQLALPASALGGMMPLLLATVGAFTPPRRDDLLLGEMPVGQGGFGSAPEEGRSLFNKGTYEELKAIGSKGGRISGLRRSAAAAQRDALRAVAAEMKGAERDELMAKKGLYSDADYTGPKDWDKSTAAPSVSRKQLDDDFPWLKDAFKQSESQKAAIAKMKSARAGGAWGGDHSSPEARAASAAARAEKEAAAAAKVLKKQLVPDETPPKDWSGGVLDEAAVQEIKTKAQRQADYSRARYDQMKAEKGLPPRVPRDPQIARMRTLDAADPERVAWEAAKKAATTERMRINSAAAYQRKLAAKSASVLAPRDVAAMRTRGSAKGSMLWAINPDTGGVRLSQYIPDNAKYSDDLFATHADWFDKINFPVAGPEFDRIPRGYAQIDRGRIHITDNGLEEEQEGLTSPPLTSDQYRTLTERIAKKFKLPSFDEGGLVGETGLAMVHKGETILPTANDTLKRAIELNTAATLRAEAMAHARTERLVQGLELAIGVVAAGTATVGAPRVVAAGWTVASASVGAVGASGGGVAPSLDPGSMGAVGTPGGEAGAIAGVSGGGTSGYCGSGGSASGSPAGMNDIYNLPNSPEKAIGGILRNGSKPGGIFSSAGFGNLKSTFGIGGTPKPPGFVGPVQTGTSFKSVMGSQGVHSAESAGGAALFEAGAFGERRGTWAGVGETTAGGAAFGAQFGPWGAAIGAAAGFGVGIGEKLAGVESEQNKAKRLVKQIYSLSINNDLANQIAGIAKSTYGNDVGMAVRSEQVQKLLRLWAETMGNQTALVNLSPHSASLIEAGGKMNQGAVYDNGTAYTYGSAFPTYGGVASQNLPIASPYAGGPTVVLNAQQTVDLWRTGTAQAISGDPRAVAGAAVAGGQASASRAGMASNVLGPSVIAY